MKKSLLSLLGAILGGAALSIAPGPASAAIGPLLGVMPHVQYGDGLSFSLPTSQIIDGCTKPGCDYYVRSTPGAIKDLIVLGTGASGDPVNTNFAGMDDAYSMPSGKKGTNFLSTTLAPDPTPTGTWDRAASWDSTLSALQSFLNSNDLIFFFNNNNENSLGAAAQTLAAWARVWISVGDSNTPISVGGQIANFVFTNMGGAYLPFFLGGGGVLFGDPTTFDGTAITAPTVGTNAATDYVLSGGEVCADAAMVPQPCDGSETFKVNHNLGADQAAYAIIFPELNAVLNTLFTTNPDGYDLSTLAFHMDFRLGCDPAFGTVTDPICTGSDNGFGKNLNNGYEQIFIGTVENVVNVPEPGTLALLGGVLGAIAFLRRRPFIRSGRR